MYNQTEKVNIRPKSYLPVFRVSQNDVGRTLTAHLVSDEGDISIPAGATVTMAGTKPSGLGYTVTGTIDGSDVSFDTDAVMTDEPGRIVSEIRIVQGDTLIGTTNVVLSVEPNPHPDDTTDGRREPLVNEITALLTQITEQADRVEEYSGKVLNMTVTAHESETATVTKTEGEVVNLDFGLPRGPQGPQGIPGEDGVTPDFTIGTVETLAPGEQATATITGTDEDPVLNLGIPQGAKGDKGDPGDVNADGYYPDLYAGGLTTDKGTVDKTPYLFRASPSLGYDYNRESGSLVGGTVGWNQLVLDANKDYSNGESTDTRTGFYLAIQTTSSPVQSPLTDFISTAKKYTKIFKTPSTLSSSGIRIKHNGSARDLIIYQNANLNMYANHVYLYSADFVAIDVKTANGVSVKNNQFIDLTAMFGATIADYIYSLEQATARAGVAWFRKYFPEDYYPYSQPTLQSVQATAHKTYDGDENVIGEYALDSSLTLRGIPKLDASNNLYYDGDTYASDGTVTRKMVQVAYDGSADENWIKRTSDANPYFAIKVGANGEVVDGSIICDSYLTAYVAGSNTNLGINAINSSGYRGSFIYVRPSDYETLSIDDFKARLTTNPITVVYELTTPTTETAQSYTNPQIVDPDGTEEYVTANSVPVGHETLYIEDLKAKLEDLPAIPEAPSTNGTYTLKAVRSASGVTYSWVSG